MRLVRQHELERRDEVRRDPEQHLALGQRLGDEPELELLEVAQAAVDQLGARRRGRPAEIALLGEQHPQAAPGGVARDPDAVDAAADDDEIVRISQTPPASAREARR